MNEPKPARRSHSAGDRILAHARQPLTVSRSPLAIVVTPAPRSAGLWSRLVRPRFGTGSQDLREGTHRHRHAKTEDHERADRRQSAHDAPFEAHAVEGATGANGHKADPADRRGQAEAEGEDQDKAES